jgi:hypothetical protein
MCWTMFCMYEHMSWFSLKNKYIIIFWFCYKPLKLERCKILPNGLCSNVSVMPWVVPLDGFVNVLICFLNQYKLMLLQMVGSKLLVGTRSYFLVEVVGSNLAMNNRTYKINLCLVRQVLQNCVKSCCVQNQCFVKARHGVFNVLSSIGASTSSLLCKTS